jgi:hypothetical protein
MDSRVEYDKPFLARGGTMRIAVIGGTGVVGRHTGRRFGGRDAFRSKQQC